MYLPLFIIIDVIFVRILAELLSQEDKYLLKKEKHGTHNKTNMMLRRDTYWHQRKQKKENETNQTRPIIKPDVAAPSCVIWASVWDSGLDKSASPNCTVPTSIR